MTVRSMMLAVSVGIATLTTPGFAQTAWQPNPNLPGQLTRTAQNSAKCGYTVQQDGAVKFTLIDLQQTSRPKVLQWSASNQAAASRLAFQLDNNVPDAQKYPVSIFINVCGLPLR
jgi:hypothetical protein